MPPASELLLAAIESAPVGIMVVDVHGVIVLVNTHVEELFGYRRAELLGQAAEILVPEAHRVAHGRHRLRYAENPQRRQMGLGSELHGRRKDGVEFIAEIGLQPTTTESGPAIVVSIVDITQRTLLQNALTESEERYHALFDALQDGVAVILDGYFVVSNDAIRSMVGYEKSEFESVQFTRTIAPEHSSGLAERYRERMTGVTDPPTRSQVQLLRRDGSLGPWVEINARRITFHGKPAALVVLRDITERVAATNALALMADTDSLTGLVNRRVLVARLRQAIVLARQRYQLVAVLYIDLDKFKPVNDKYGHAAGDKVLCEVASRLTSRVRATDIVSRLGGDEFVVLLTGFETEQVVTSVARDLLEELRRPFTIEADAVRVGASIGIACFPSHGEEGELLMKRADEALYAVKASGRNGIRVWLP